MANNTDASMIVPATNPDETNTSAINLATNPDPLTGDVSTNLPETQRACNCPCDHKECDTINDIFDRAATAVHEWTKNHGTAQNSEAKTKAEVLAPFVEEFDKAWPNDEDECGIDFTTAQTLDNDYFGTGRTTHWRAAFDYPAVGQVLNSSKFSYDVPECGYVVISHGLLTMNIALNDPKVLHIAAQREALELEHDMIHAAQTTSASGDEHCKEFARKMKALDDEFNALCVEHYSDADEEYE